LSFSIFLFNISITIFLLPRHQRRALTTRNQNVLVGGRLAVGLGATFWFALKVHD
jgi:hypothetical protein